MNDEPRLIHTWFGDPTAPLFGALHVPAGGRARGAALVLPPVGIELIVAHRALRVLGDGLARRGIAALRLDYAGTGDSVSLAPQADHVPAWLASVERALEYLQHAGADRVAVVGLRLGATLAARAARGVDALVLWDPVETGRRFLREEQVLFEAGVPGGAGRARDTGGVLGPGTSYSAATAASIRTLSLADVLDGEELARGVGEALVATRAGAVPRAMLAQVAAARGVDTIAVPGQDELFDWADLAVPVDAIDAVVRWLDEHLAGTVRGFDPEIRAEATVAVGPDGSATRERIVRFGARQQFGIVTSVEGRENGSLVLANAAPPAYHIGPARLWVEVAREHAATVGPVLRFDGATEGESADGGTPRHPSVYTAGAVDDVAAAVATARGLAAGGVTVAGLCAAAWSALKGAEREGAAVVVAFNPAVWRTAPMSEREGAWPSRAATSSVAPSPRALARMRRAAVGALRACARLFTPEWLWWRLARRGLVQGPAGLVTPLVRRGTRVHLVLGPHEFARFQRMRGGRVAAGRAPGYLVVVPSGELDHALMTPEARDVVATALAEASTPGGSARRMTTVTASPITDRRY